MNPQQLLSAIDVAVIALMIPIIAIFTGGAIAVASIITKHQRQMAEMIRKEQKEPGLVDEIRAMRAELADLRDRVNQQTLAIESKNNPPQMGTRPPDLPRE